MEQKQICDRFQLDLNVQKFKNFNQLFDQVQNDKYNPAHEFFQMIKLVLQTDLSKSIIQNIKEKNKQNNWMSFFKLFDYQYDCGYYNLNIQQQEDSVFLVKGGICNAYIINYLIIYGLHLFLNDGNSQNKLNIEDSSFQNVILLYIQEKGDKSMGVNPCSIIKTKISKNGYLHGKNTLIFSNLSGKFCPNKQEIEMRLQNIKENKSICAKMESQIQNQGVQNINDLDFDSVINDGLVGLQYIAEFRFKQKEIAAIHFNQFFYFKKQPNQNPTSLDDDFYSVKEVQKYTQYIDSQQNGHLKQPINFQDQLCSTNIYWRQNCNDQYKISTADNLNVYSLRKLKDNSNQLDCNQAIPVMEIKECNGYFWYNLKSDGSSDKSYNNVL